MKSICSVFMFGARPNGTLRHVMMPRYEDGSKRSNVCYWQILLKIQRLRKSCDSRFFVVSAAASVCTTGTRTYGRFCLNRSGPSHRRAWGAPAALKNFVRQPKRAFQARQFSWSPTPSVRLRSSSQDGPMKCPAAFADRGSGCAMDQTREHRAWRHGNPTPASTPPRAWPRRPRPRPWLTSPRSIQTARRPTRSLSSTSTPVRAPTQRSSHDAAAERWR